MRDYRIRVTTEGADGSATGTGTSEVPVQGRIDAVYLNFHASAPNTTDTTIAVTLADGSSVTLLTVTNSATDAYKQPRIQNVDSANSAITGSYDAFICAGQYVTVSVAGSNALTNAVVVTLLVSEI
jgi:hypothetical protein